MRGTPSAGRTWSRAGSVLALVVLADQVSKRLVKDHLGVGDEDAIFPAITLVHTQNRGVAFSALQDETALVVIVIALALLALLLYVSRNLDKAGIWLPTGLLTGGAAGNIVDRVREGAVTDFIKLPAWPAFNVADMAITFGVLALAYVIERRADVRIPDAADRRA